MDGGNKLEERTESDEFEKEMEERKRMKKRRQELEERKDKMKWKKEKKDRVTAGEKSKGSEVEGDQREKR